MPLKNLKKLEAESKKAEADFEEAEKAFEDAEEAWGLAMEKSQKAYKKFLAKLEAFDKAKREIILNEMKERKNAE